MKRAFRFALVTYVLLSVVGGIFLCEGTLHPVRRQLSSDEAALVRQSVTARKVSLEDVSIHSADDLTLRAWLIRPEHPNGSVVILLHGLSDNRLGMLSYASFLLANGYTALLPDARAHGLSEGGLATYGLLERDDIHRWAEFLREREHPACIYGFGESMGAAQMLQALGTENSFCAVVVESPFSNLREIGYDRVGQQFHTGPWLGRTLFRPLLETAFLWGRLKYHLDLSTVSPEDSVAHSQTPILLIHGAIDSNIPLRHSERIVAGARLANLDFWSVARAEHTAAFSVAPAEFERKVLRWFQQQQGSAHKAAI